MAKRSMVETWPVKEFDDDDTNSGNGQLDVKDLRESSFWRIKSRKAIPDWHEMQLNG